MDMLKTLTRRDWISIAVFCLAMFIVADSAAIKGGVCASSPCSTLNQSFTDDRLDDNIFSAHSIPYVAPSAGLSYLYFKDNPSFEFEVYSRPYYFTLDSKDEKFSTPESWLQKDKRVLSKAFFIHEFFVLLSLPLWLGIALALRHLSKRKNIVGRLAGIVFWLLIVFAFLFSGLRFIAIGLLGEGESDDTLRMLF
ncbi:hypothetical protein HZC53_00880 [Candidatus Uhrbacteria bacterium]|nr:hypothetical protein [Candidatus Uhrbacteria bacterium]